MLLAVDKEFHSDASQGLKVGLSCSHVDVPSTLSSGRTRPLGPVEMKFIRHRTFGD